jgi:hypothetical protein
MSPYVLAVIRAQKDSQKIVPCSETTLTGESRFHISPPRGIWTWVPCDRKQTGSPLDQWDMVRMKWDCRVSTPHKKIQTISVIFYSRRDNMSSWNGAQKPVLGRVWPIASLTPEVQQEIWWCALVSFYEEEILPCLFRSRSSYIPWVPQLY